MQLVDLAHKWYTSDIKGIYPQHDCARVALFPNYNSVRAHPFFCQLSTSAGVIFKIIFGSKVSSHCIIRRSLQKKLLGWFWESLLSLCCLKCREQITFYLQHPLDHFFQASLPQTLPIQDPCNQCESKIRARWREVLPDFACPLLICT